MFCIFSVLLTPFLGAKAEMIFQDDFEADGNWQCTNVPGSGPSKWSAGYTSCGSTSGFGAEWKIGPGHNSNNAVYAWKSSQVPNGYRSESMRWLSGSQVKREIYHRWYMKMPMSSAFDKAIPQSCKLWRYILNANGYSGPGELYLNFHGGSKISNSSMYLFSSLVGTSWGRLKSTADLMDDKWHAHEVRIRLNTAGNNDGIIQYWFDGVLTATYEGINMGYDHAQPLAIHRIGVGMGNCSDDTWLQTQWSAIAFDDVALGTEYIGPIGGTVLPVTKPGDLNNSGQVDVSDLGILLGNWGSTGKPASDINQDGKVDVSDLGILLGNWG